MFKFVWQIVLLLIGGHFVTLAYLNLIYTRTDPQSAISAFAEGCEAEPADWPTVNLNAYKGLQTPLTDADFVLNACRQLGRALIKLELTNGLPQALDAGFYEGSQP